MKAALILSTCLLSGLMSGLISAQAAPAKPAHQLEAPHIRLLKALQVPVAVPGYLPKDCTLHQVTVTQATPGPGGGPGYEIEYFCDNASHLTVRGASGGFGGPSGDKLETVWNPVYGKLTLMLFLPGGNQPQIKTPYYYSDWAGKGPLYYSIISGEDESPQVSVAEAKKVLQGLKPL